MYSLMRKDVYSAKEKTVKTVLNVRGKHFHSSLHNCTQFTEKHRVHNRSKSNDPFWAVEEPTTRSSVYHNAARLNGSRCL